VITRQNEVELFSGWTFQFEDGPTQPVTLPHTWNALDTMDTDPSRHYRRGRGTYTYDFTPPPNSDAKRLWVRFGAVAQRGWVYFDGELIGEHHGGYTAFTVELPNRPGELRVVADNTPDPDLIPSDMSDFFLYGGITRPVFVYSTGRSRVKRALLDIDTTAARAAITLHGRVDGVVDALHLVVRLWGPDEKTFIYEATYDVTAPDFSFRLPDVVEPLLWSPDTPNVYTAYIQLYAGEALNDVCVTDIGFRWFDFPQGGPFTLNGERLLLRGTHRHDDWAGYGAAVPQHHVDAELRQIKDAGFNFIRLGHYPQDDDVLSLCNSLGLIVWEEIPWCRGGLGGDTFKAHTRMMLREMIEQHYNSPAIIFWGLGNELDWESEHPDSTDEKVAQFLSELHEMSHELDDRRLTALRRFEQGAAIVDVYSPSIWSGWYRGRYEDYERVLTEAMDRYPRMLHIEWGGDSHLGRHNDGPHITTTVDSAGDHGEIPGTATSDAGFARYSRDGDWSESYIIDLMAHHLAVQGKLPRLAGTAQWIFKDFGTPLRPENPVPYVNQKGLVARDGTPKDVYHVFRAFQSPEPVVHVESSGWLLRVAGSQRVRVISNCDRVQLSIDDAGVGARSLADLSDVGAGIFVWEVELLPGEHTIEAVGYIGGKEAARHRVRQRVVQQATTHAVHYTTTFDHDRLIVQLVDDCGIPVFTDERRVRFDGDVRHHHGIMGGSDRIVTANGRAWIRLNSDETVRVFVEGLEDNA
jgi:beta-galactosidase